MRTITIHHPHLPVRVISVSKVTKKIPDGQKAEDYIVLQPQEFLVFKKLVNGSYTSRQLCCELPVSHSNSVIRNLRQRGFPVLDEWVCGKGEHPHKLFTIMTEEEL